MKVQLCILMSAAIILAAHQAAGDEGGVRERPVRPERNQSHSRRQYTRSAQIHDDKTDPIRLPEAETDTPDQTREERYRPPRSESLAHSRIPQYTPHLYNREVDRGEERPWLVSAVIDALHQRTDPDSQDAPQHREASGWGWFTDSTIILIEQRERERFLAQEEDQEDRLRTEEFLRERRNLLSDTSEEQWSFFGFTERNSAADMETPLHEEAADNLFYSERSDGYSHFDVAAETDDSPSRVAGRERSANERVTADSEHRFTSVDSFDYLRERRDDDFSSVRRADDDLAARLYRPSPSYVEERNTALSSPFDSTRESAASTSRFDSPSINVNDDLDRSAWRMESQLDSSPMRPTTFDRDPWDSPAVSSGRSWDTPDYSMPQARDAASRRTLPEHQSPRSIHDMWD